MTKTMTKIATTIRGTTRELLRDLDAQTLFHAREVAATMDTLETVKSAISRSVVTKGEKRELKFKEGYDIDHLKRDTTFFVADGIIYTLENNKAVVYVTQREDNPFIRCTLDRGHEEVEKHLPDYHLDPVKEAPFYQGGRFSSCTQTAWAAEALNDELFYDFNYPHLGAKKDLETILKSKKKVLRIALEYLELPSRNYVNQEISPDQRAELSVDMANKIPEKLLRFYWNKTKRECSEQDIQHLLGTIKFPLYPLPDDKEHFYVTRAKEWFQQGLRKINGEELKRNDNVYFEFYPNEQLTGARRKMAERIYGTGKDYQQAMHFIGDNSDAPIRFSFSSPAYVKAVYDKIGPFATPAFFATAPCAGFVANAALAAHFACYSLLALGKK